MIRILVVAIALIVYGSLYPWHFHASTPSPLLFLLHSWPAHWDSEIIQDNAVNILLYLPIGLFAFLAIDPSRPAAVRFGVPIALALLVSASLEMLQTFVPTRVCSLLDVTCNVIGAALGVVVGRLFERPWRDPQRFPALLLLSFWCGYQVVFVPYSRTVGGVRLLLVFAEWVCAHGLIRSLANLLAARLGILLAFLLLLLRPFALAHPLIWPEIGGAALAVAYCWLSNRDASRSPALLALLAGAVIINELAPIRFTPIPKLFAWIPFHALFEPNWRFGTAIILRKAFDYGAVTWLLWRRNRSLVESCGIVFAGLICVQALYLQFARPLAASTDPFLAVVVALLFGTAGRQATRAATVLPQPC